VPQHDKEFDKLLGLSDTPTATTETAHTTAVEVETYSKEAFTSALSA